MSDYLADVKKYDPEADAAVVDRIVKHLGIALRNRDSSQVSASDKKELERVRDNWAVKKLGADAAAGEAAVAGAAKTMAADRTKHRVTFYYLVAKELGKLKTI
ncbi:DUF2853 family protein [Pseudaminobacter sp. 19-2017]|uniref:DUF2853 family protein n=1 Tax=Pseudaminobacter soli (ex Zhang et al. 2022) TaxID=2831468 RepID=A0A942I546_9HYPH|nr:DUF2853 family protein [Pseudaminobacter soli]MBS3652474.1 DUF2853 family protein [Pseudaminobacter soli]